MAKGADEVVIATDYDREGELIGHEALEILRGDALKRHPNDKPEKKQSEGRRRQRHGRAAAGRAGGRGGDPHVKAMLPAGGVDRHLRVRYSALTAGGGHRPPSPSPPRSTSTSPRRRTRARTSTSSGARC